MIVAVGLAKAFGATGGVLALPTAELRYRVRRCGGPMIFSGPIVPSALGAALASAQLHLSPAFEGIQAELLERMKFTRAALLRYGLVTATDAETPIFMMHFDSTPAALSIVRTLRERGFFLCVSTFPAVPMNKPSIRFTISRHNSFEDIQALVDTLAEVTQEVSGVIVGGAIRDDQSAAGAL